MIALKKYSILLFLFVSSISFSQVKFEREKRVEITDVPEKAVHFISQIDVKKVKWFQEESQDGKSFEAKFKHQKHQYSVEFSSDGILLDIEKKVAFKRLSVEVQNQINKNLKEAFEKASVKKTQIQYKGLDDELLMVFKAKSRNELKSRIFFELIVKGTKENESGLYELLFDELGKLLKSLKIDTESSLNLQF